MKKYLVTYHSPPESMAAMADATPEQMAEGMKPWMEWQAKVGSALVDMGSPLCSSTKLTQSNDGSSCINNVTGFSIVQAENMEEAKKLFDGHPHLGWDANSWVEVHETMSMG
ncbi:MAG: hypothetical protein ACPGEG_08280 [Salibacteraceae bacterium]